MRFPFLLLCACAATLSLNSCVSAWISMTGKKEIEPKTRQEAIATYGQPVEAGKIAKNSSLQADLRKADTHGGKEPFTDWEMYEYHGLMQDQKWASEMASSNASSLGIFEAVNLPVTLVNRTSSAATTHRFLALYRHMPKIEAFESMDGRWKIAVEGLKQESPGDFSPGPLKGQRFR